MHLIIIIVPSCAITSLYTPVKSIESAMGLHMSCNDRDCAHRARNICFDLNITVLKVATQVLKALLNISESDENSSDSPSG